MIFFSNFWDKSSQAHRTFLFLSRKKAAKVVKIGDPVQAKRVDWIWMLTNTLIELLKIPWLIDCYRDYTTWFTGDHDNP